MSLLGLGGPKCFAKVTAPYSNPAGGDAPTVEVKYVVVNPDGLIQPAPMGGNQTFSVLFGYGDDAVTIEAKVLLALFERIGQLNLNVVLIP